MIATITLGRGNKARTFDLPCNSNRKVHVDERIKVGNILKSNFLFPQGKGFKEAKARGAAAMEAA